jgi:hypothetical protein
VTPLSSYEFRENLCSESHVLHKGISDTVPLFPIFFAILE